MPAPVSEASRGYTAASRAGSHGFRAPPSRAARALLSAAQDELAQAEHLVAPTRRFAAAHLAALRGAAAVLAVRAQPGSRAGRPTSAWTLLGVVAPELAEWAAFFAAGSTTRAAAEAGLTRLVSQRDADDLVRQAGQFLDLAARLVLGDPA